MFEVSILLKILARTCCIYTPLAVFEHRFRISRPASGLSFWWPRVSFLALLKVILGALWGPAFAIFFLRDFAFLTLCRQFWIQLPWALGFFALFLVHSFTYYWAHRLMHNRLFWRSHQLHHSPDRFEVALDLYAHPIDFIVVAAVLTGTVFVCGFGLSQYTALGVLHGTLTKILHLQVRTPRWLGYLIFRPEQHGCHHSRHNVNYGVIPVWDQVFGTFQNCSELPNNIGFSKDAQSRFWQMFFLKTIN